MPDQEYDSHSWATEGQWVWLWSRRTEFLAAQKNGRVSTFTASVYRDWPTTANITFLMMAAGVTKRSTRLPQKVELYSKKYYLQGEGQTYCDRPPLGAQGSAWASAYFEGKAGRHQEIQRRPLPASLRRFGTTLIALYAKAKEAAIASDVALEDNAGARTPSQFQAAIEYAPQVLEKVLNPLARSMGWTFSIFGAGPVPEEDARTLDVTSTATRYLKPPQIFEEQFIRPFGKFAKSVFRKCQ
ncbi:hypothetical protein LXA43DRAFT_1100279 [Ganoderma leucocontextum]|nr:hypothetical protein LXA43DRAFT_1100279 [Ganoderma leucocontextum]